MNSETQITEIQKYKLQDNRRKKIRNTKIQIKAKGIYKYKLQIYQNTSYRNI